MLRFVRVFAAASAVSVLAAAVIAHAQGGQTTINHNSTMALPAGSKVTISHGVIRLDNDPAVPGQVNYSCACNNGGKGSCTFAQTSGRMSCNVADKDGCNTDCVFTTTTTRPGIAGVHGSTSNARAH